MVALWLEPGFSQLIAGDAITLGWRKVVFGLASAVFYITLFIAGNLLLPKLLIGSSGQVASIYALKSGQSQWRIGIFLALIIGPGEELWWRGFLQRHWTRRLGKLARLLAGGRLVCSCSSYVQKSSPGPGCSGLWSGLGLSVFKI